MRRSYRMAAAAGMMAVVAVALALLLRGGLEKESGPGRPSGREQRPGGWRNVSAMLLTDEPDSSELAKAVVVDLLRESRVQILFESALSIVMLSRLEGGSVERFLESQDVDRESKELLKVLDRAIADEEKAIQKANGKVIRPLSVSSVYSVREGANSTEFSEARRVIQGWRTRAELEILGERDGSSRAAGGPSSDAQDGIGWAVILKPCEDLSSRDRAIELVVSTWIQYLIETSDGNGVRDEVVVRRVNFQVRNGRVLERDMRTAR